jgi:hypothetical protein
MFLMMALMTSSCASENHYGECVGLGEDKRPDLEYKVEAWNIIAAIVFVEALVVPIYVSLEEVWCPTGPKVMSDFTLSL